MDFPDGLRCKVRGGSVPNFSVYGETGGVDGWSSAGDATGYRAGVALTIPLYASRTDMCDKPMKMHLGLQALETAESLLDSGAMTEEEFMTLAKKVKSKLMKFVDD